ncbi:MAG: YccF domain-containing protein [Coprothermobacterota bacterium]|nr:YccF domain-containing protein [Coprothermobacterota bacterium]
MSLIGNILWIILGGFLIALEYFLGGLILCLTIVGIPFGAQCFKLAYLALFPFGKEVVTKEVASNPLWILMNILWLLFGGIWIALTHLVFALLCAITVIGIPFALQHIKLAGLSLSPFGKEISSY